MTTPRIAVSNRYRTALADASIWHQHQFRKGSDIPYLSHLLAVSAAVMEDGGDEDETIAGLLHDSIEDTGVTVEVLVARYGHRVADIVAACTDDWGGDAINKAPWWPRKVHHIGSYVLPMPEGHHMKKVLYRQLKRARVDVTNRVVATRILMDNKGQVAGLLGFDCRSGDFVVVRAKAVILCCGAAGRIGLPTSGYPWEQPMS